MFLVRFFCRYSVYLRASSDIRLAAGDGNNNTVGRHGVDKDAVREMKLRLIRLRLPRVFFIKTYPNECILSHGTLIGYVDHTVRRAILFAVV